MDVGTPNAAILDILPQAAGLGGVSRLTPSAELPGTPPLDWAPARVLPQVQRPRVRTRVLTTLRDSGWALALHVLFAASFLVLLHWRPAEVATETAIPVEIVAGGVPGESGSGSPSPGGSSRGAAARDKEPPARASTPSPPAPAPAPLPQSDAALSHAPPPPALVAPPPEPMRAATQALENKAANDTPEVRPAQGSPSKPPPEAQKVLTTAAEAKTSVAPRAESKPEQPATSAPIQKNAKADETAKLTAALPMDLNALPPSFRAVLSSAGQRESEQYKGLVYGRLGRSPEINERARAKGLRGQVIVGFTIANDGSLKDLSVAHTSGNAEVDTLALDMVRAAAPFPPPPPDAKRSFTPALTFGD